MLVFDLSALLSFLGSPAMLALLTGLVILIVVGISLRSPLLLHLGIRNTLRRPGQSLLLLCGLIFSAALIVASYGLNYSLNDTGRLSLLNKVGNLDESVSGFNSAQVNDYLTSIRQHTGVEAASGVVVNNNAVTLTSPRTGFTTTNIGVLAVSSDFDRTFGLIHNSQGQTEHFSNLQAGDIFISSTLAQNFDVQDGDHLNIKLFDQQFTGTVRAILTTDVATNGDIFGPNQQEIIMPLAYYQHVIGNTGLINTICIKNVSSSSLAGSGPNSKRSQEIAAFLKQLFHIQDLKPRTGYTSIQPSGPRLSIIKPNAVENAGKSTFFSGLNVQDYKQFTQLLPALTLLLVGAGMLLLALLFILLTIERRAELGMSRAIGMQRSHVIQSLLIEGCGYGLIASILGIPLGMGIVELEVLTLSRLHLQTARGGSLFLPFHVWIGPSELLAAFCLSLLTTIVIVLLTALWISRMNIITAIQDLNEPPIHFSNMLNLWRRTVGPALDSQGMPIPETLHAALERRFTACLSLLWELCRRGPLFLMLGILLLWQAHLLQIAWANSIPAQLRTAFSFGDYWIYQLGLLLLIVGGGWLIEWLCSCFKPLTALASRLGLSLIGIGCLAYGIQPGGTLFSIFQPPGGTFFMTLNAGNINGDVIATVLTNLMLVAGTVMLVIANADIVAALITIILSQIPYLAPLSRMSLVYPLTYRFRTLVIVTLLGMILFLITLIVTINVGTIQEDDLTTSTGGFQLSATGKTTIADMPSRIEAISALRHDIAVTGIMQTTENSQAHQRTLSLPGKAPQNISSLIAGINDAFLENTTMPLQARAQGFSSDRQIWETVRTHQDYAVWHYESGIAGINPNQRGFRPFTINTTDDTGHIHPITVIGIVSANTHWPDLYVSDATFSHIYRNSALSATATYLFQLRAGVSETQATKDLMKAFGISIGMQVETLLSTQATVTEAMVTIFLSGYLAMGLLFGALALGVIMSRAVIERRQQIGMLRALGFSRNLVQGAFLLEGCFIVTLSLAISTGLALWSAYKITSTLRPDFPVPIFSLGLIFLGSYVITVVTMSIPVSRAARIRPVEALRYE